MDQAKDNRRTFIKKSSGLLAGVGLSMNAFPKSENKEERPDHLDVSVPIDLPNNPLVLFDNFHVGNRRGYSFKTKFASAEAAGFDGFELVMLDSGTDAWKEAVDLIPSTNFKIWGLHRTTKAVVDPNADNLNRDIEKIEEIVEASTTTPIEYITLSLSGGAELWGGTIHESGSARAEDRHWKRAYKIISAFDAACKKHGIRGSLYPHTHWICDTPQSQKKILEGANASTIGPALCSHHWYANKNSVELDEALSYDIMKNLNYVVMTNGRFNGDGFPAVRFDLGEIDMAWFLAKIYEFGYKGPISSQGWGIGGDPYFTSKMFVDTVRGMRERFLKYPKLWPLG